LRQERKTKQIHKKKIFREADRDLVNMKTILKTLAATLLLAGLSAPASASYIDYTWSDLYDPNPDLTVPPSRTYTHNLTDDGFRPGIDFIGLFSLSVYLYDDAYDSWRSAGEWALVDAPGSGGDRTFFSVGGSEFGGWSLAGWLQLNLTGMYTVTIEALSGDFLFGASRLDARGYRAVPEPGTLALLALGIIGMGVVLSRRRSSQRKD
jgi:hypothetical protein